MSMEIWALVSDEEKRQLEAIAATKQLRTGTALREAIQEYLDLACVGFSVITREQKAVMPLSDQRRTLPRLWNSIAIDQRFRLTGIKRIKLARVLVRFDHVARFIVNANHSIM